MVNGVDIGTHTTEKGEDIGPTYLPDTIVLIHARSVNIFRLCNQCEEQQPCVGFSFPSLFSSGDPPAVLSNSASGMGSLSLSVTAFVVVSFCWLLQEVHRFIHYGTHLSHVSH